MQTAKGGKHLKGSREGSSSPLSTETYMGSLTTVRQTVGTAKVMSALAPVSQLTKASKRPSQRSTWMVSGYTCFVDEPIWRGNEDL